MINHTFKIDSLGSTKSQKRPTMYVFVSKNWSTYRMHMLFTSTDRYGSQQASEHTGWVTTTYQNFFTGSQSQAIKFMKYIFEPLPTQIPLKGLWWPLKPKKLLSACVFDLKNQSKHRMSMPFVSANRLESWQALEHIGWVSVTYQKVFTDSQSQATTFVKSIFWSLFGWNPLKMALKPSET